MPVPTSSPITQVAVRCYVKLVKNWEGTGEVSTHDGNDSTVNSTPINASPSRVAWNHSTYPNRSIVDETSAVDHTLVDDYAVYSPILERYAELHRQPFQSSADSFGSRVVTSAGVFQSSAAAALPSDGVADKTDMTEQLIEDRRRFFPSYDPSWDSPFVMVANVDLTTDTVDSCAIKALAAVRRGAAKDSAVIIPSYDVFLADKEGYVVGHLPSHSTTSTRPNKLLIGSIINEAYATAAREKRKHPELSADEAQYIVDSFSNWTPIPLSTPAAELLDHKSAIVSLVIVPRPPYALQLRRNAAINNSFASDCVATVYSSMNACVAMRLGVVERQHAKDERDRLAALAAVRAVNVAKVEEVQKGREIHAILKAHKIEDTRLMEQGLAKKERRGVL